MVGLMKVEATGVPWDTNLPITAEPTICRADDLHIDVTCLLANTIHIPMRGLTVKITPVVQVPVLMAGEMLRGGIQEGGETIPRG
jgi:hypothetical protein